MDAGVPVGLTMTAVLEPPQPMMVSAKRSRARA
jgi:hypothetical protein